MVADAVIVAAQLVRAVPESVVSSTAGWLIAAGATAPGTDRAAAAELPSAAQEGTASVGTVTVLEGAALSVGRVARIAVTEVGTAVCESAAAVEGFVAALALAVTAAAQQARPAAKSIDSNTVGRFTATEATEPLEIAASSSMLALSVAAPAVVHLAALALASKPDSQTDGSLGNFAAAVTPAAASDIALIVDCLSAAAFVSVAATCPVTASSNIVAAAG